MKQEFTICSPEELPPLAAALEKWIDGGRDLILLHGDLGAGKTQLVKSFVRQRLGQDADSPTFALVNSYGKGSQTVHHFDLYRMRSLEEIEDIGLWDYVDQGVPCLIEWPEKIAELLPAHRVLMVRIVVLSNQCRSYSLSAS